MKQKIKRFIFAILNFLCRIIPEHKCEDLDCKEAELILQQHSSDPATSPLWRNEVHLSNYDLSIIVPVFNAENYLDHCMMSILNQITTYRYQVIVVNDGSTDHSAILLKKYSKYDSVVILEQRNMGASAARNAALRIAQGKYITFVDADDYLPNTAVQALMETAYRLDADIVQGGYYYVDGKTNKIWQGLKYADRSSAPPNGCIAGFVCGKVYKSHLFEKVCFPEGYWFEDTIITGLLTHLSKQIATISENVYFYRRNHTSMTKISVGNPKSVDAFYIQRCMLNARNQLGLITDQAFYEHLLKMVVLIHQRTQKEPKLIKKCLFILSRNMLQNARGTNKFNVSIRYKTLDRAITRGEYIKYCILCKFATG